MGDKIVDSQPANNNIVTSNSQAWVNDALPIKFNDWCAVGRVVTISCTIDNYRLGDCGQYASHCYRWRTWDIKMNPVRACPICRVVRCLKRLTKRDADTTRVGNQGRYGSYVAIVFINRRIDHYRVYRWRNGQASSKCCGVIGEHHIVIAAAMNDDLHTQKSVWRKRMVYIAEVKRVFYPGC